MTQRDQAIIDAVGQAYRNTGKAVPSVIVAYLPPSLAYSHRTLERHILPRLAASKLIEKVGKRGGYKPAHQNSEYCPCCGRRLM